VESPERVAEVGKCFWDVFERGLGTDSPTPRMMLNNASKTFCGDMPRTPTKRHEEHCLFR
jgi:hypothetical protein